MPTKTSGHPGSSRIMWSPKITVPRRRSREAPGRAMAGDNTQGTGSESHRPTAGGTGISTPGLMDYLSE